MATSPKAKGSTEYLGVADGASAVTPSDSTLVQCRALWVGGTGNVAVTMSASGSTVTFTNVPDGTLLPVAAYRVMAATTATNIVALY